MYYNTEWITDLFFLLLMLIIRCATGSPEHNLGSPPRLALDASARAHGVLSSRQPQKVVEAPGGGRARAGGGD